MDILIHTLSSLSLDDVIPIIEQDKQMDDRFRQYVNSGYYIADVTGEVDVALLPDLEQALLPFDPKNGYPPVYHLILDLYDRGFLPDLPKQVKEMLKDVYYVRKGIDESHNSPVLYDKIWVRKLPVLFEHAKENVTDDRDTVLAVVTKHWWLLKHASDRLKDDESFVLAMMEIGGPDILTDASDRLKEKLGLHGRNTAGFITRTYDPNNRTSVLDAIKRNGHLIRNFQISYPQDKDLILAAVGQDGMILQDLDKYLRDEKEIVLTAVGQKGNAIQFASDRLKQDRDVLLTGISAYNAQYVSDALMDDYNFVMEAVQREPGIFALASDRLQNDRYFIQTAITSGIEDISPYLTDKFKDDKIIALLAIDNHNIVYEHLSHRLQNDKDIVIAAFQRDETEPQIASIPEHLLLNKDVIAAAIVSDVYSDFIPESRWINDAEILWSAVKGLMSTD